MKFFQYFASQTERKIILAAALLIGGWTQLLARPDPPAADRLMDPSKPENQGAQHLFFHTDDAPAAPTPSEQAFKDFKKGPATFAEFCKLHPLAGKPLGQDRFVIEVLTTAADASVGASPSPAEPTAAMLSEGNLIRQRVFANSQAQTENVLPLDRQSDGSKLPEPAWEGERLFTSLERSDNGYQLSFTYAESRVEGWVKAPGSTFAQPIISQREMNQQLLLNPDGKWVAFSGEPTRDETPANGGPGHKVREVVYVRLLNN